MKLLRFKAHARLSRPQMPSLDDLMQLVPRAQVYSRLGTVPLGTVWIATEPIVLFI